MTDLSTANLKRLLDEATPGPWEYKLENGYIMSDLVETLNGWIQTNDGETVLGTGLEISDEQELRNLALAAAAPDLAAEVLRMRREMSGLYNELARTATDCSISDHPGGKFSARVAQAAAQRVFRVLLEGDHDG